MASRSHRRNCFYAKIIRGFQVCLSVSLSTTHDECAFCGNFEKARKNLVFRLCDKAPERPLAAGVKVSHVWRFPAVGVPFTVTSITRVEVIPLNVFIILE